MLNTQRIQVTNSITNREVSFYTLIKRVFDLLFAITLLVILFPFFVVTCFVIYVETGSSPYYIQLRGLTLEGREFRIFKFRTLKKGKNNGNESPQIFLKENLSGLVTKSGYILRKTGLDELPQLLNILLGEMSFIGPRPLSHDDLLMMKNTEPNLYYRRRLIMSKPGISGFWQIYGDRSKGVQNLIEQEEYYESNKSFLYDLFLIFMTLPIVMFAKHSDAIIGRKD